MTTVPTRGVAVSLAEIANDTVPDPRVAVRPATLIQLEYDTALHGHADWADRATVILDAAPPTLALAVFSLKPQVE